MSTDGRISFACSAQQIDKAAQSPKSATLVLCSGCAGLLAWLCDVTGPCIALFDGRFIRCGERSYDCGSEEGLRYACIYAASQGECHNGSERGTFGVKLHDRRYAVIYDFSQHPLGLVLYESEQFLPIVLGLLDFSNLERD